MGKVVKEILSPLGMEISVSEAEYMIVVEVNPSLCGFSVVQQYEDSLHECNLQKACAALARSASEDAEDVDIESETGAAPDAAIAADDSKEITVVESETC